MLSAVPPSGATAAHHSTVRRPALFLSPYSGSVGSSNNNSRIPGTPSSSPASTPRILQQQSSSSSTSGSAGSGSDSSGTSLGAGAQSEVRLAVLGSMGVGKSALVVKYITKRFIQEYDPYLEDIYRRTETVDSRCVCVRIMDTSDTPEKKPERYLKWANGFIVVYSIVNRQSFDEASRYLEELHKHQRLHSGSETPVVLVGNKADLERYRTVSRTAGEALAARYDCAYFESSAAEDYSSVAVAFARLLADALLLVDSQPSLQSLFITEDRYKTANKMAADDRKEEAAAAKLPLTSSAGSSRRSTAAFKLFNKGFKIFN